MTSTQPLDVPPAELRLVGVGAVILVVADRLGEVAEVGALVEVGGHRPVFLPNPDCPPGFLDADAHTALMSSGPI